MAVPVLSCPPRPPIPAAAKPSCGNSWWKPAMSTSWIAIRSNFFYTRTVPSELWFFNRNKLKAHKNKVRMIDARNVYRKVTRKINDFPPEQQQNLQAIVWLYRGKTERYLQRLSQYLGDMVGQAHVRRQAMA